MGLKDEMALVAKLISLEYPCKTVFEGITTQAERKEKVRTQVLQCAEVTFSIENGRRITMSDAYSRAYHEALE